ncbi:uracil-DNA glycosylase [Oceanidesulfovibrio indonesiensis]|uniref:Type-4 uracil-DNA glycosylase n=1 Tax=Oceanidesulfovibrio indonesiensis TaxID=54767 RepID=A0A7M3MBB5_9BACT|nr:uracil-DNA glycosylase [Oceanidesulfovibrio indonesiensis]TVM15376.1 uracil-DNA glycosylase [Oceanidesulfovibrio indonesiensis]
MDIDTLATLARGIQHCRSCRLWETRTHAVPGSGAFARRTVLLGEAPGEKEDELGLPFMGRTGRFLDGFLEHNGFHRDDFFITPAVKCRPPKNRDPRLDELAACRDRWLGAQLEALEPRMILLAGKAAVRQTLGLEDALTSINGRVFEYRGIPCLVTYHPTAMMRFKKIRETAVKNLANLHDILRTA